MYHGISAFHSNLQGSTNISFTNFQHLTSQQSKKPFPSASPFECPRSDAIVLVGEGRPLCHRGAAPGCRRQHRLRGHRWPWPRSWKSRPRFYTNLSQFDLRTLSFLRVYCKHMFKVIEIAVGCGGKRNVKIVFAESTEVLRN